MFEAKDSFVVKGMAASNLSRILRLKDSLTKGAVEIQPRL